MSPTMRCRPCGVTNMNASALFQPASSHVPFGDQASVPKRPSALKTMRDARAGCVAVAELDGALLRKAQEDRDAVTAGRERRRDGVGGKGRAPDPLPAQPAEHDQGAGREGEEARAVIRPRELGHGREPQRVPGQLVRRRVHHADAARPPT